MKCWNRAAIIRQNSIKMFYMHFTFYYDVWKTCILVNIWILFGKYFTILKVSSNYFSQKRFYTNRFKIWGSMLESVGDRNTDAGYRFVTIPIISLQQILKVLLKKIQWNSTAVFDKDFYNIAAENIKWTYSNMKASVSFRRNIALGYFRHTWSRC